MTNDAQIIIADNFSMRAVDYALQGNTDLGIRGSGKSYTASKIAEQLLHAHIPLLVFDPTGIWHNLRNGVKGNKGFPIVVVGGMHADIPLPFDEEKMDAIVAKVVILVRSAMQQGISIVVDMFGMAKSNWQKIVIACVRLLLKENYLYGIRHVILEEAAEFIPQRPNPGNQVVYGLLEQMARTGRNFGIGYTLINQRAEEIAKAVFELCEMVFVHRQKGKNSLKSIREWLDHQAIDGAKGMVASIPKLVNGECWVISENGEQRINVNEKETFHPSPKEGKVTAPHDVKKANTAAFIKAMLAEINKAENEKSNKGLPANQDRPGKSSKKETKDPLKQELLRQLTTAEDRIIELQNELLEEQRLKTEYANLAVSRKLLLDNIYKRLFDIKENQDGTLAWLLGEKERYPDPEKQKLTKSVKTEMVRTKFVQSVNQNEERTSSTQSNSGLPKGELKVLTACAQFTNGLNRKALTVITGYTRRTRDAYIFALRNKGLAEIGGNDKVLATAKGITELGSEFKKLPTGAALKEHWLKELPQGERIILEKLINVHSEGLHRDSITELTGYTRRTRDAYIYNMLAKEIVEIPSKGIVKASDYLFD